MRKPVLGELFSPETSDEEVQRRPCFGGRARTDVSGDDAKRKGRVRLNFTSDGGPQSSSADDKDSEDDTSTSTLPSSQAGAESDDIPDGYIVFNKLKAGTIRRNTIIQYKTVKGGKIVKPKYFKKWDQIADAIVVGYYPNDRRNYLEALANIDELYVPQTGSSEKDELRDTIVMSKDGWKTLRRDMIISYEKSNHDFIYRSKFNAFTKGSDGSSRMSLTSERGFSYTASPSNIINIYRHVTSNDKTLAYILESIRKIEVRLHKLETRK